MSQKVVLIILIIPILALIALTFYKRHKILKAVTVTLPITVSDSDLAYVSEDAQDILSGYTLRYHIQYGVDSICQPSSQQTQARKPNAYICLKPEFFSYEKPSKCDLIIKGFCISDEFYAGIESHYLQDIKAQELNKQIKSGHIKVVLSVFKNGKAIVRDILF